jgi:PBSX family phage terminase large subunit
MPRPHEQDVVNFIPHEGQKRVFLSDKRFIFALSGQRGGKTMCGCYWAYMGMQTPNTQGLIAANTFDQLNQSVLATFFDIFPQLRRYYIKRDKMLSLPNNSKVFFRSLEMPDLIKGLNLHWAWADEIDGIDKYTWEVLRSRTATTGGKILGTSSIYANSWIKDYVTLKNDPNYEIISWASIDNPSFPKEEWEALKREMNPVDFDREYGGKFSFATGKVFEAMRERGFLDEVPEGSKPLQYVFGLDFGVTIDPTALIVMSFNTDGCWYILDEKYQTGMSIDQINEWIKAFIEKYQRPFLTVMDPAGGIARLSLTPESNAYDGIKKIDEGLTMMRNLLYAGKLYCLKSCTNTVREFMSYSYLANGKPEDRNNHSIDAARYVIHTTYPMLIGLAKNQEKKEEMTPFWRLKQQQGLYKGDGKLEDITREKNYLDEFEGGDRWDY